MNGLFPELVKNRSRVRNLLSLVKLDVCIIMAPVPVSATKFLFGTGIAGLVSSRYQKKKT